MLKRMHTRIAAGGAATVVLWGGGVTAAVLGFMAWTVLVSVAAGTASGVTWLEWRDSRPSRYRDIFEAGATTYARAAAAADATAEVIRLPGASAG